MILLGLAGSEPLYGAEADLHLQPSVCALAENQTLCQQMVDIQWRTDNPLALCLFVERQGQPLECWQAQERGEFRYRVNTDESLVFQLRSRPDEELLASEIFEVIREYTEYRSRRRKPWNFF